MTKRIKLLIALIGAIAALVTAFGVPSGVTQTTVTNSGTAGRDVVGGDVHNNTTHQKIDNRTTRNAPDKVEVKASGGGAAIGGDVHGNVNIDNRRAPSQPE